MDMDTVRVQEVLVACVSVGLERRGGEADHLTDRVPLLKVLGLVQYKRVTLVHELDGLRLAETVEALLEDDLGALGLGRLLDLLHREPVLLQEELVRAPDDDLLVLADHGQDPGQGHQGTCLAGARRLRPHLPELLRGVEVGGYGCGKLHPARDQVGVPEPVGKVVVEVLVHPELVDRDCLLVDPLDVLLEGGDVLRLVALEDLWLRCWLASLGGHVHALLVSGVGLVELGQAWPRVPLAEGLVDGEAAVKDGGVLGEG